ncbi:MAG: type IV pilus modification protein PilV [Oceanospirillaceae bacterium]|nr:type IV pilus modification protein PilV [Oceanospirillaceae bacterium]
MNNSHNIPSQAGASLIEVLVSTVIISIVLLGLMSLQITSLQANQSAYARSQASILAYDILERMRVNSTDVTQYFSVNAAVGVDRGCVVFNEYDASGNLLPIPLPLPNCTSAQIAEDDLFRWRNKIEAELALGNGLVCRSDLQGDSAGSPDCEGNTSDFPIVVYIWWQDSRGEAPLQLSVSSQI